MLLANPEALTWPDVVVVAIMAAVTLAMLWLFLR